jgi:hypothetical protein
MPSSGTRPLGDGIVRSNMLPVSQWQTAFATLASTTMRALVHKRSHLRFASSAASAACRRNGLGAAGGDQSGGSPRVRRPTSGRLTRSAASPSPGVQAETVTHIASVMGSIWFLYPHIAFPQIGVNAALPHLSTREPLLWVQSTVHRRQYESLNDAKNSCSSLWLKFYLSPYYKLILCCFYKWTIVGIYLFSIANLFAQRNIILGAVKISCHFVKKPYIPLLVETRRVCSVNFLKINTRL